MAAIDISPAEIEKRYTDRVQPWIAKGVKLVSSKLDDARAHAEKAVTDTLRSTRDGRPSLAMVRANPSYRAALRRLDELWEMIGGPSVTSLQGFVQDASVAFYEDAREHWWDLIDPDFRVATNAITDAQRNHVRGLLWHGLPIRQDFEPVMRRTRNSLVAALHLAGSTTATKQTGYMAIHTWHDQATSRLMSRIGLAISDANVRADQQAMRDTISPQWHG